MKILVVTQALDTDHEVLGFFHEWVRMLAPRTSHIHAIALFVGRHSLPENVSVYSLGKERKKESSFVYAYRFLTRVWKLRHEYDAVFVHMNQEYVLLAGFMWRCLGKRVYLWRNHYAGSFLTDIAAVFATKVFYTSLHSYTACYAHAVQMPVGVKIPEVLPSTERMPHSLLWLGRISPSKRPTLFIDALAELTKRGVKYNATVVGSPRKEDAAYYDALVARARPLGPHITFHEGVTSHETSTWYLSHQVFINTSPSGMFDKTLFEAAAHGAIPLACSEDWKMLTEDERLWSPADSVILADKLETLLTLSDDNRRTMVDMLRTRAVTPHILLTLMDRLCAEMSVPV